LRDGAAVCPASADDDERVRGAVAERLRRGIVFGKEQDHRD
jgi:hypothetical protein